VTVLWPQIMSYQTIQLEFRGTVAVLTLNRPESLNALTLEMGREFQAAVSEALQQGARAIILTGAGRAFCAGGDLRDMQRIAAEDGRIEAFFDDHYACFMIAF
jgi:enoyl-CoA hydratase/carnithine racemase